MKRQVIATLLRANRPDLANVVAGYSCPLRSLLYGGMPEAGGFKNNRELEVGLQLVAEAAHCILGSLGRHLGKGQSDWEQMKHIEYGHLREELGLILSNTKEYQRDIYLQQVNQDLQGKYTVRAIDSIRKTAPQLEAKAKQMKLWLQAQKDIPIPVKEAAAAAYDILITLSQAAQFAVQPYPEPLTHNPFRNRRFIKATRALRAKIHVLYGLRYKEHTKPREPMIEERIREQRQLKRERQDRERRMKELDERYGKPERKPRARTPEDEKQVQELMDLLSFR